MSDDLVERLRDWPYMGETYAEQAADRIEELQAQLAASEARHKAALEALELANNNLTNLQPKIPQWVAPHWVPCLDGFIDPVIVKVRETLAAIKGAKP